MVKFWQKNKKYFRFIIIILVLLLGGWVFFVRNKSQIEPLSFVAPQRENITASLTVSGIVEAKQKAHLSFATGGKLTEVKVEEGSAIKKGAKIASIDKATLQKQLEQNLNNYMQERYNFENIQDNIKDRAIDTKEERSVAQKQYDLNNRVLNVEIQKIAINNTILTAPFDGLITTIPKTVPGVYLTPNDYFELVDPDSLIFRAAIDEIDLNLIKKGQKAEINLNAYDNEWLSTYINYIAYHSLNGNTGTVFMIEFPLNSNNIEKYRLGMNGDVKIKLAEKKNALVIPIDAVYEKEDRKYVFVSVGQENEKIEKEIITGIENDEKVEVVSGLNTQDLVVLPD